MEVPTDMFELTLKYKHDHNRGCIGSTADILKYIKGLMYSEKKDKYNERIWLADGLSLDIVLGTEAGMVCSIIKSIQSMLKEDLNKHSIQPKSVNIIFPVANDAVVQTSYAILLYKIIVRNGPTPILPGAHADGCSIHGMLLLESRGGV